MLLLHVKLKTCMWLNDSIRAEQQDGSGDGHVTSGLVQVNVRCINFRPFRHL